MMWLVSLHLIVDATNGGAHAKRALQKPHGLAAEYKLHVGMIDWAANATKTSEAIAFM